MVGFDFWPMDLIDVARPPLIDRRWRSGEEGECARDVRRDTCREVCLEGRREARGEESMAERASMMARGKRVTTCECSSN